MTALSDVLHKIEGEIEAAVIGAPAPVPEAPAPPQAAPAPCLGVEVAALVELMARVEHDVVGQCWQLWGELKTLVAKASA